MIKERSNERVLLWAGDLPKSSDNLIARLRSVSLPLCHK